MTVRTTGLVDDCTKEQSDRRLIVEGPASPATPISYINGQWARIDEHGLTVTVQGLHYGTGVFDGIRGYWSEPDQSMHVLCLREHLTRFLMSCRLLRLDTGHSLDDLERVAISLIERNGHDGDIYLRPLAFTTRLQPGVPFGVRLSGVTTTFAMYAVPMPSSHDNDLTGARCGVSSWRRVPDESVPARGKITGSYVNVALALDEAQAAGYDDAILLNTRGFVAEATTSNVFLVRGAELVTPGPGSDILEGITRSCVMRMATDMGLIAVERDVHRSELLTADEVFLTGTGCEITPVTEIDGRVIGEPGVDPVTSRIRHLYHESVRGRVDRYREWVTTVALSVPS